MIENAETLKLIPFLILTLITLLGWIFKNVIMARIKQVENELSILQALYQKVSNDQLDDTGMFKDIGRIENSVSKCHDRVDDYVERLAVIESKIK